MSSVWWRVGVLALCFLALVVKVSVGDVVWVVVLAVCIGVNAFLIGASINEQQSGGTK